MSDTASPILLLRIMGTGDHVNLWGGYLNTNQKNLERGQRGFCLALTDRSKLITWNNYSATNSFAVGLVKQVAGSVSASHTTTLPSYAMKTAVWNTTGFTSALKTSAGTPIEIPHNYFANVFGDGSNIISPPMFVNGSVYATEGSLGNNLATRAGVSALIAAQLTSGDGSVLVAADDTTRKFLETAVVVTSDITKTIVNSGGNKTLQLSVTAPFDEGQTVLFSEIF